MTTHSRAELVARPHGSELSAIHAVIMDIGGDWPEVDGDPYTLYHVKRMARELAAAQRAELARQQEVAEPVGLPELPTADEFVTHPEMHSDEWKTGWNAAKNWFEFLLLPIAASRVPVALPAEPVAVKMWHQRAQEAQPKSDPEFWPLSFKAGFMEDEIIDLRAALSGAGGSVPAPHPDVLPREELAALVVQEACETEPADPEDIDCIKILTRDLHCAVLAAFMRHHTAPAPKQSCCSKISKSETQAVLSATDERQGEQGNTAQRIPVTDAMVEAYLIANNDYWVRTDTPASEHGDAKDAARFICFAQALLKNDQAFLDILESQPGEPQTLDDVRKSIDAAILASKPTAGEVK